MPQTKVGRKTARGIVLHGDTVLLMERWRIDESGKKLHYFSIPGGKIEPSEIPEITVVRELYEETSLLVRPSRLLAHQKFSDGSSNAYFLCDYLSGSPALHASAPETQTKANHSKPRWLKHSELKNLPENEVYEPIRKLIVAAFENKLPEKPLNLK